MDINAIFFDLDDTLHDHQKPFVDAFKNVFSNIEGRIPVDSLYKKFRDYSDLLWDDYSSKKIPLEELRIKRMVWALKSFDINISNEQAGKFQQQYDLCAQHLELFPEVTELLITLKKRGYHVGIITNGPTLHQMSKIEALGLTKYISKDLILISDEIGIAKPNPQIFHYAAKKVNCSSQELLYIGDSWPNDVLAPSEAGWRSIWFNHRKRQPGSDHQPLAVIENLSSLVKIIMQS